MGNGNIFLMTDFFIFRKKNNKKGKNCYKENLPQM